MKLGKKPARPDAVRLKFGTFFNAEKLPTPPLVFGHYGLGSGLTWGVLANDKYSDCVFAGAAHETMVWTHRAGTGQPVKFQDQDVLEDYAALTGFDPSDDTTDQGTDMVEAASYRRKVGIVDAKGVRHKIESYVALKPGDCNQLALATYLMGATGLGIVFPDSAMKQFDHGQPWEYEPGSDQSGGHYVPCVGRNSDGNFLIVTWGRLHAMTPEFYEEYCDEALAYVSIEQLKNDLSPEGFNSTQLRQSVAAITRKATVMTDPEIKGTQIDPEILNVAFLAVRAHADRSQYGRFISDAECKAVANEVIAAVEGYKTGETI